MAPKKQEPPKPEYVLETAPVDIRYPNVNQTRHCFDSYVSFHKCIKYKGENYEPCQYFKNVYTSMCPNAWIEKWDTQRADNCFPGKI